MNEERGCFWKQSPEFIGRLLLISKWVALQFHSMILVICARAYQQGIDRRAWGLLSVSVIKGMLASV